ncbi:hypothetical protein [Actinoplanes sp. NPDC049316]|uniref:hypothetical protein n=1 Tax=Actinoplanes sp. NPDC049316 TaxID=3154727 RepID=UPI003419E0F1
MTTRALIGTEAPGGRYLARRVHADGYPQAILPVLCAVVHQVHGGDLTAAVNALTATHWSSLRHPAALTGPGVAIGTPSDINGVAHAGRLDEAYAGDQEWAYLFAGHRIHGYVLVHRPGYRLAYVALHCWYVHDLPTVSDAELRAVQQSGYLRRRTETYSTRGQR